MKALTICQPYAELIARGEKTIENRTWSTPFRGLLFIHAGKSRAWMAPEDPDLYPEIAFGALVATARLVACLDIAYEWPEAYAHLKANEHANGPWCWILEDVNRIEPIPYRGAQGLWAVPSSVALTAMPPMVTR
jgi:activating signal cointegrator 1